MTLQEAALALRKEVGQSLRDYEICTIAIAPKSEFNPEERIVVYVHKKGLKLPETYEGYRIETRHVGRPIIKRSKDGGI